MLALLCPLVGKAGSVTFMDEYNVSFLTHDNGLPHNFVDDMYMDSEGFVWVAMAGGGLSRYDGYEFVGFNPNSDVRHLKSAFVLEVAEDGFKRLWAATDGGIDVINVNTLKEDVPVDLSGKYEAISDTIVWSVTTAADGCIWLGTATGLSRIKFDADGAIADISTFNPPYGFRNKLVIKDVLGDGHVWASVDGVITDFSVDTGGHVIARQVSQCLRFPASIYVTDYEVKDGEVWISTDAGLWRYNKAENQVKSYHHDESDPNSISQDFVTSVAVTADKRLVAGSLRGLNVYNPIQDNFVRVQDRGRGKRGLGNNFINCILVDGSRIWLGTEVGGINLLTPRRLDLRFFRSHPVERSSMSSHPVNSIYQDSEGMVWIGTVEGGLSRTDAEFGSWDNFTSENSGLSYNSVSAIAEDSHGRLWIGTWGGGLDVVEKRGAKINISHHIDNAFGGRRKMNYIGAVIYDPINGCMWIGCARGLYCCDPASMELFEPFVGASETVTGCVAMAISPDGHLWVGGNSGLCEVDLRGRDNDGHFPSRFVRNRLDNPDNKNCDKIASLRFGSDGSLWIGTNGSGVYRRTVGTDGIEAFKNLSVIDGLSNNVVLSIMEDMSGRMWFGTGHGLSSRLPNGQFVNYDRSDGLLSSQFYWNAYCHLADGKMVFGTIDGIVVVGPDAVRREVKVSGVKFTNMRIDHNEMSVGREVSLHERDKSLYVGFSALDYSSGGRGSYFYRLKGFDQEWIRLASPGHGVTYTNLSAGDYLLQVKYLAPGMTFDEAAVSGLPIEVRPYFYKQWWFVILMLGLVSICVVLIHQWRVRELMRQKMLLQQAVDERTSEISRQKRMLEERAVELSEQNRRLKINNVEILSQKTRLADMARRVRELSVDRISFFTNITHEFRTPITLIIGPIERALKLSYNPQVIEQLHFAERNSKYLLSLVNQLMDFRKVESGKMEIVRSRGNFRQFVSDTVGSFRPMAADRGIDLKLLCRLSSDTFSYDEEALRKVLINLLGNAVKFTPDGGCVRVYAAIVPTAKCGPDMSLYIDVCDSGNGIDEADIERVFERFYQGNSQLKYPVAGTSGSGIGLYLCKSIVEIYGGHIWARNNAGGCGCSFRLLLPVDIDADGAASASEADLKALPAETGPDSAVASGAVDDAHSTTILVVEDNSDMRAFIRSILSDHYSVVEASNGEEALTILMNRHVDFIVSDLMMPVMDGLELSRRVKEDFAISHIPFLMLTAKTSNETKLESFRTGVDEYIQKPFDEELLLARIRNILDNKQRQNRSFGSDMDVGSLRINEESRDKKFMEQVMTVVKENYKNSYFEVGDFAEALGISRSLLNKKLQSLAGQSAGQLMRSYRMNLAREMIIQNRRTRAMNISEIAYEVGFNDSKYFTRCFTKQFGVSPSAFMSADVE